MQKNPSKKGAGNKVFITESEWEDHSCSVAGRVNNWFGGGWSHQFIFNSPSPPIKAAASPGLSYGPALPAAFQEKVWKSGSVLCLVVFSLFFSFLKISRSSSSPKHRINESSWGASSQSLLSLDFRGLQTHYSRKNIGTDSPVQRECGSHCASWHQFQLLFPE